MYHTETAAVDGIAACARFAPLPSARRDMPDATLIARIATGDRLAMHALFARHKTRVYRFILCLVHDVASADDLTSEVFLAVWRHALKFQGRAAASTWLLAIARFKALQELRRRRDTAADSEEVDARDPAADPEACCADNHRGAVLRKCLGALSPEHRTIIDLVYYHEKSAQEVAAIVGIPCATVKTRMFHARKELAALLAAQGVTHAASSSEAVPRIEFAAPAPIISKRSLRAANQKRIRRYQCAMDCGTPNPHVGSCDAGQALLSTQCEGTC